MNSKKVLIFSTAYYPFVGGAEVAVKEITDRISDIEFHLITAKMKKGLPFREKIGNVIVYRLGVGIPLVDKLVLPFEGALFAKHLEKKHVYGAYWCVMASFASGAAYIKNIFSSKKVPIILNLQEGDSEEHLNNRWFGLINLSWKMALSRANFVTALSDYLEKRARRLGFVGQSELVPMGVDLERFDTDLPQDERLMVRKELGLNEGDVGLITTSRLVLKNGVGDVVEALSILPANFKFVICGVGEFEESLKLKAKILKLENRVIFAGNVSHGELPKYLKACDIFIRPSLSEGFGVSFIEAMALCVPVIATPVGGIVDFLYDDSNTERQTGYFCKPHDPKSIADTVNRVIEDSNKNIVVDNAYNMVRDRYDWQKIAMQMREVFDRVIT